MNIQIKENDVLIFKNGNKKVFYEYDRWVLDEFYDENLCCKEKDEYDIVEIKRPYYDSIKLDDTDVHTMSRINLELELLDKRKKVMELEKEIAYKDGIINIYGNYIDDMNTNLDKKVTSKSLIKKLSDDK